MNSQGVSYRIRPVAESAPTIIGRGLREAVERIRTWQERARQRRTLNTLTDVQLRDIGLSRADVRREAAKPFWRA